MRAYHLLERAVRMVRLHIRETPPSISQVTPSEMEEKKRFVDALQREARNQFKSPIVKGANVKLVIKYSRCTRNYDGVNIIGGIANALENIVYINDRQITEIHYSEEKGEAEEYWIEITKIK